MYYTTREDMSRPSFDVDSISRVGGDLFPIYVTSFGGSNRPDELKRLGVRTVVRCRTPKSPRYFKSDAEYDVYANREDWVRGAYTSAGIDEFIITLDDQPGVNISSYFRAAIDVIHRTIANGDAVLVQCDMGISRSITIVMAYLLWSAAHDARSQFPSVDNLLEFIRTTRPIAHPNDGFMARLREYHSAWDRVRKYIGDPNGYSTGATSVSRAKHQK
jgi:hypothetical protein